MRYERNAHAVKLNRENRPRVIGITGGIGSGKTVATDTLREHGHYVVDADEVSRRMFARGTDGERALCELFPQASKNGALDRAALRRIISTDKTALEKLNSYTHPLILEETARLLDCKTPVVLSAPLLFETGLSRLCDVIVCVYCPREERIKRLTTRDGVTYEDAVRMIDVQIPDTERATLADYVVPSNVPIDEFRAEIVELFEEIIKN